MGTNQMYLSGKTVNTQPTRVLHDNPDIPRIVNRDHPTDNPQLLAGGAGSSGYGRRSKLVRRHTNRAERRDVRTTLHEACKLHRTDTDTVDIRPLRKMKVGWKNAAANPKADSIAA